MTHLTIVIGYRERGVDHADRCLASLARQKFTDFELIFVDYGSSSASAQAVANMVRKYPFCRYVYSDTRGQPWSRSRALNIGIRLAESKYIMTTDIDMLFPPEFLDVVMDYASERRVLYCTTHFLPRGYSDWENLPNSAGKFPVSDHGGLGGCQVLLAAVHRQLRGFDEFYSYWGVEDRDLNRRLLALGLEELWLNDYVSMFHQWHSPVDWVTENYMPDGLWARAEVHFYRHKGEVVRNSNDWGSIRHTPERKVFDFIDVENGCFKQNAGLMIFDEAPDNNISAGNFVDRFWELPSGQALAVKHALFPEVTGWARRLNRVLRRVKTAGHLGWRSNRLHTFLAQFMEENSDLIADYYLRFPALGGVSVIVRA